MMDTDDLPGEEWRAVADTNLEASNLGRMRGPKGLRKPQSESKRKDCYLKVGIGNHANGTWRNIPIHVAVCEAWHGPKPSPDMEVCHRNGDCKDNRAENLKWGTKAENEEHKRAHGRIVFGEDAPNAKLNATIVAAMRDAARNEPEALIEEIAARYGVAKGAAIPAIIGKTWRHVPVPPILRGRRRKVSREDVLEIIALDASGVPQKEIAARYGIRAITVSHMVCGHGCYAWTKQVQDCPR